MKWWALPLLVFLTVGFASSVSAAKRVALVIGNSAYESAPLMNPVNDAADISAVLGDLHFDVITSTNASKREMVHALHQFGDKLRRAEIGIFYYAGHGLQIDGTNYLVPVDTNIHSPTDVEYEALNARRILGTMEEAGNLLNIVILDACRNNPFRGYFRSRDVGLAKMEAPIGSLIAYATAPGSIAADGNDRNGTYTKHLLTSLRTPGLTIQEIFNQTGLDVMRETNRTQVPWFNSSPMEPIYLAGGSPATSASDAGNGYATGETGSLTVASTPPGAQIKLNGTVVGRTPLVLDRIHTGFMEVRINRDGYKQGVKEVLVTAGERISVQLELERVRTTGTLTVLPTPDDATVRILNIKPRYFPGIELAAGNYLIEVASEGYTTQEQWLEIEAGKDTLAHLRLEKETQPARPTVTSTVPQGKHFTDPATGMAFVFVPGGCFQMGDIFAVGVPNERPVHEVCVDDFYIGKYEVTQGEYRQVTGHNPAYFMYGDRYPIEQVSYDDAKEFIAQLRQLSGRHYRLPTEAEWEYAARSGGKDELFSGRGQDQRSDDVAWTRHTSSLESHMVGTKAPNGLDIHDMSGSVWEWCSDWYDPHYYSESPRVNPTGPGPTSSRVARGGSWFRYPKDNRTTFRIGVDPAKKNDNIGFRLALPLNRSEPDPANDTTHQSPLQSSPSSPGTRLVNNGDGTVTDHATGLMWAAQDNGSNVNWYEANEHCTTWGGGGYTDWRLPTYRELDELYTAGLRPVGSLVSLSRTSSRASIGPFPLTSPIISYSF